MSNGDVGYKGRSFENKLNMTGTTHGSIECIDGQWYVFYHRLTHKSDYSRQACAEKIYIAAGWTHRPGGGYELRTERRPACRKRLLSGGDSM